MTAHDGFMTAHDGFMTAHDGFMTADDRIQWYLGQKQFWYFCSFWITEFDLGEMGGLGGPNICKWEAILVGGGGLDESITIIPMYRDPIGSNNDVTFETLIRENSWFFCEYCNYKTKKEKGLTIHIGKVHSAKKEVNDESFKWDMCYNVSTSESMLKVHKTSFHSWKCRYCIIMNVNNREKHMREGHTFIDTEHIMSHIEHICIKMTLTTQTPLTLPSNEEKKYLGYKERRLWRRRMVVIFNPFPSLL